MVNIDDRINEIALWFVQVISGECCSWCCLPPKEAKYMCRSPVYDLVRVEGPDPLKGYEDLLLHWVTADLSVTSVLVSVRPVQCYQGWLSSCVHVRRLGNCLSVSSWGDCQPASVSIWVSIESVSAPGQCQQSWSTGVNYSSQSSI